MMAPVTYIAKYFIPLDLNTNWNLFGDAYYRYYVWSNYIPTSQIFFYIMANIFGFMFINIVNLGNTRSNPLIGGNGGYKDFKIMLMTVFGLFFASGIVILRQKYGLVNYCDNDVDMSSGAFQSPINDRVIKPVEIDMVSGSELEEPLAKLFFTVDKMNYL